VTVAHGELHRPPVRCCSLLLTNDMCRSFAVWARADVQTNPVKALGTGSVRHVLQRLAGSLRHTYLLTIEAPSFRGPRIQAIAS
jgi:hypothetical protein